MMPTDAPLPFVRSSAHHQGAVAPRPRGIAELPVSVGFEELARMLGAAEGHRADHADERFTVRRLRTDDTLHREGDPFRSLYVVRSGYFKTARMVNDHGVEQVIGFPVGGDAIGADSLGCETHATTSTALLPSAVVILPYARFVRLAREDAAAQALLERIFSNEMTRRLETISMLGALKADERVCAFLLSMGERLARTGYSRTVVSLPMTRSDIGRYLGIRCETAIRAMSRLADAGVIDVGRHGVTILDRGELRQVVANSKISEPRAAAAGTAGAAFGARSGLEATA